MKVECRNRLPEDMLGVLERFEKQDALRNSCYVDVRNKDIVYVEPEDYFPKEIREEFFSETEEDDN